MDRRHLLIAPLLPLMLRLEALANTAEKEGLMSEPTQRIVETNGIRLNIAEQGKGPLVLLCHGFPESWYSWRHQLGALAAAGFHAVAPDMRGYGKSDRLEAPTAVIVGHDWGATVAWQTALLRPDRFRAVIGLSVPFRPRGKVPPTSAMPRTADAQFYQLYFQEPGLAEAELERDPRATVHNMLYGASGDAGRGDGASAGASIGMVPRGGGFLRGTPAPAALPAWLSERDVDFYAAEFQRTGFRGALNWYRNIDRNWELLAPFAGAPVTVPALYVAGDRDMVVAFPGMDQLLANLRRFVPALRNTLMLAGCGHWTQQERPGEVNAAMIDFLHVLPN
jgi:pimeloyl-ACP methyl ester carboxylesterase